jgi:hypothetical protein
MGKNWQQSNQSWTRDFHPKGLLWVKMRPGVLGIRCLYHSRKQTSFILEIEHVPLAVDYLSILRDWRIDAGAAFGGSTQMPRCAIFLA